MLQSTFLCLRITCQWWHCIGVGTDCVWLEGLQTSHGAPDADCSGPGGQEPPAFCASPPQHAVPPDCRPEKGHRCLPCQSLHRKGGLPADWASSLGVDGLEVDDESTETVGSSCSTLCMATLLWRKGQSGLRVKLSQLQLACSEVSLVFSHHGQKCNWSPVIMVRSAVGLQSSWSEVQLASSAGFSHCGQKCSWFPVSLWSEVQLVSSVIFSHHGQKCCWSLVSWSEVQLVSSQVVIK